MLFEVPQKTPCADRYGTEVCSSTSHPSRKFLLLGSSKFGVFSVSVKGKATDLHCLDTSTRVCMDVVWTLVVEQVDCMNHCGCHKLCKPSQRLLRRSRPRHDSMGSSRDRQKSLTISAKGFGSLPPISDFAGKLPHKKKNPTSAPLEVGTNSTSGKLVPQPATVSADDTPSGPSPSLGAIVPAAFFRTSDV